MADAYLIAVASTRQRGTGRYAGRCWLAGTVAAAAAVTGPLAEDAHTEFTAHMAGHLLVGMIAPLLLVSAAPVSLALACSWRTEVVVMIAPRLRSACGG
ncbi:cytochrome c oxidase assembly protein [Arthrobacter sp. A5]|uniref:cytochrome c oxidase assembly protein n=1 Tax=Arthrobacter sp. A5 TaxID=576926 RepID=UPI003DA86C24